MRAQPVAGKPAEVVLVRPRADRRVGIAHRDEIALPLGRHLVAGGRTFSIEDQRHAGNARRRIHQDLRLHGARRIDAHERPERAVMFDEGIGDWADHAHRARTEPAVQRLLQIDHLRLAVGRAFVVHAVIRHDRHHGTQIEHPPDALVDLAIELIRRLLAGPGAVLDQVRQ